MEKVRSSCSNMHSGCSCSDSSIGFFPSHSGQFLYCSHIINQWLVAWCTLIFIFYVIVYLFVYSQTFVFRRPAIFSRPLIFATAFMSFFSVVIALFKVNCHKIQYSTLILYSAFLFIAKKLVNFDSEYKLLSDIRSQIKLGIHTASSGFFNFATEVHWLDFAASSLSYIVHSLKRLYIYIFVMLYILVGIQH